jgi:hypothetical protein
MSMRRWSDFSRADRQPRSVWKSGWLVAAAVYVAVAMGLHAFLLTRSPVQDAELVDVLTD